MGGKLRRWRNNRDGRKRNIKYKGRTDNNSPTGPNEAVRVATLYYYDIYLIETKVHSGRLLPTHPSLHPAEAGRKRKRYHLVYTKYEICIGK